jgi:hypothetical protein
VSWGLGIISFAKEEIASILINSQLLIQLIILVLIAILFFLADVTQPLLGTVSIHQQILVVRH